MRSLLRVLMLSIALLLVQQGAVMHELAHAVAQTSPDSDTDHREDVAALCAGCVAFSHVVSSTFHGDVRPALDDRLAFVLTGAASTPGAMPDVPSPRSRDPPVHL